ncbi:MAG: SpoIIE family protein phosphatase [Flavobacteriales bacterium]|nr:SpoIIE family protein phosphatase [Flavobacteriales bacterium]
MSIQPQTQAKAIDAPVDGRRSLKLYTRVLFFVALIYGVSGITSHLNDPTLNDGIGHRWYVSLGVLLVIGLLTMSEFAKANYERIFKVLCIAFTAHVLWMNYINEFKFQYVLALFSTVWGIGILIEDIRYITWFYLGLLVSFAGLIFQVDDIATDRMELLQNFLVAQTLAYAVIYFKIKNFNRMLDYLGQVRQLSANIEKKNVELDVAYKDIQSSIRYASNIQSHILPSAEQLRERLGDAFVIFLPSDVVSGDFYWVDSRGDTNWFAVADCTGHGIPGAFISLLAFNSLTKALSEHPEGLPSELLHGANTYIREIFSVSGQKHAHEGMDVALCRVDRSTRTLHFAGSKRPLFLLKADGTLLEEKGNREGIGMTDTTPQTFVNHKFSYDIGDTVILFSDGVVDQFGGPDGRKFSIRQLRELLSECGAAPTDHLRKLLESSIVDWKKNLPQIDDICLLGVKLD